jgi:hypothetical protein
MEKKIKKVKEVPGETGYTGLTISRKPVEFTPDVLLDKLGAPEEGRPVFMLTPMTIEERNSIDGDSAKVKSKVSMWAKDNGLKVSDFADMYEKDENDELSTDDNGNLILKKGRNIESYVAYTSMFDFFADHNLRSEIVRKNIVDVKGGDDKELNFKKDEDGFLSKEEFNIYHPKLISAIFDKINTISNPDSHLTLGL